MTTINDGSNTNVPYRSESLSSFSALLCRFNFVANWAADSTLLHRSNNIAPKNIPAKP
ncbi:hypothetical protein [Psychromonas sp. psych-6C06]|uniref:hypothetical protein n=1 Tax=Psychromonas sp. psych-6C06 TaxID=2058089 RepID=UPI00187C8A5C|nr:hypothetical protein [Psychromonas sp. psych-6C06]